MMKGQKLLSWKKLQQTIKDLWCQGNQNNHTRLISTGLLVVVLGYLPIRLYEVVVRLFQSSISILMVLLVVIGGYQLWSNRRQIVMLQATPEDQIIGYVFIVGGILLFPVSFSSIWLRIFLCLLTLIGIAWSLWGVQFFRHYCTSVVLITIGFIPSLGVIARELWQSLTPPFMLERLTAWIGTLALQSVGQPATLVDTKILLAGRALDVTWGCTGFNMAAAVAVAGLVMGIFFKANRVKITLLIASGIAVALVLNIPRVMLLSFAEAYWGKTSFDFWHDGWGSQIFSTVLFTLYYYISMAIVERNKAKLG